MHDFHTYKGKGMEGGARDEKDARRRIPTGQGRVLGGVQCEIKFPMVV